MTTRDVILQQIEEREERSAYKAMIMDAASKVQAQRERRSEAFRVRAAKRAASWAGAVFAVGPL